MAMLDVLSHLRSRLGFSLHVGHLNHQFRGKEAEQDAEFVRSFAQERGFPCTVESYDVPTLKAEEKLSPQDAARKVRYHFFHRLAGEICANKIATAHHADDQAETVLLALLRGAGLHGLGGIQPVLQGTVIRPLLGVSRHQIEAYAQSAGLAYRVDSSNVSRKYLRNAIRLDLIPFLQQAFQPALVKRLTEYAQLFQEDAFFIDKIAEREYSLLRERNDDLVRFPLAEFVQRAPTIQRALIYKAFEELTGVRHTLETIHVRAVVELFTRKETGKRLSLPQRVNALRRYEWGELRRDSQQEAHEPSHVVLAVPGHTTFGGICLETTLHDAAAHDLTGSRGSVTFTDTENPLIQQFDYERITSPVSVRFRRAGDRFRPLGMSGHQRVKKFFIDRKVPQEKRQSIPVLADQHGIIWIVGYSIDDRVKITEHTKRIITVKVS